MAKWRYRTNERPRGPFPNLSYAWTEISAEGQYEAALAASRALQRYGISHALIGGLAVIAHGYPRTTRDADFLLGIEALDMTDAEVDRLNAELPAGVDLLPVSEAEAGFAGEQIANAPVSEGVPVASIELLVYTKLRKHPRMKDRADIVELIKAGADVDAAREFLDEHGTVRMRERLAAAVVDAHDELRLEQEEEE